MVAIHAGQWSLALVKDIQKKKKVKSLDWPSNSLNLSLNENLGTLLKDKVADNQPTSAKELENTIIQVWINDIAAEYWKSLVYIMPHHLQAVIKNKGGHTKYWTFPNLLDSHEKKLQNMTVSQICRFSFWGTMYFYVIQWFCIINLYYRIPILLYCVFYMKITRWS